MSYEEETPLPERAQDLLDNWPQPTPSDSSMEQSRAEIMRRIRAGEEGPEASADALAAPAPLLESEPLPAAEPRTSEVVIKAQAASGPSLRSLAEETLRSMQPEQAPAPLLHLLNNAGRANAGPAAVSSNQEQARDQVASPIAAAVPPTEAQASSQKQAVLAPSGPRGAARNFWYGVTGVLALAAGTLIWAGTARQDDPTVVLAPPRTQSVPAVSEPVAIPDTPEVEDFHRLNAKGTSSQPAAAAVEPAPEVAQLARRPQRSVSSKPLAVETPASPPLATKPPSEAQRRQATADEPPMVPAAGGNNLALKPSVGAIQGALASVLGSARNCVAGQTQASRARVTFGSDGRVKSVSVGKPAAGTPAEGCIRQALSQARVAPFAESKFSVSTTVRP